LYLLEPLVLTTSTGERREIRTTEDHPFWSQTEREFQRADELDPGELVLTADGGTMEVHAVLTEEVAFEQAWNLTVQGLHTYSVIATGMESGTGGTRGPPTVVIEDIQSDAVLVHNCDVPTNNVVLGIHEPSEALAAQLRGEGVLNAKTFNGLEYLAPDSAGRPGWMGAVNRSLTDRDTTIHVALDKFDGDGVDEMFMNAYQAGRANPKGPATQWEMARLGYYVRSGDRSWETVKFYLGGKLQTLVNPFN
jgi:hypothetical protein